MGLNFSKLTDVEVIAIKQASDGLVSGSLAEWPYLRDAFYKLGLPCYAYMRAPEARNLCKLIVKVW